MKLKPLKANMTELDLGDKIILFSYRTPVAYYDKHNYLFYRTNRKFSNTTTRHINQWLGKDIEGTQIEANEVDQEVINNLIK